MFASTGAVTYRLEVRPHADGYVATFPAVPECRAYGPTYQEALENVRKELRAYVDAHIKEGVPFVEDRLDTPSALSVTIRLPVISSIAAGKRFGFTHDHVARLCRRGHLRSFKAGRSWFLSEESLKAYIQDTQALLAKRNSLLRTRIRKDLDERQDLKEP